MDKAQVNREPLKRLGNNGVDKMGGSVADVEDFPKRKKSFPEKVAKKRRVLKLTNFFPLIDKQSLKGETDSSESSECSSALKENIKSEHSLETSELVQQRQTGAVDNTTPLVPESKENINSEKLCDIAERRGVMNLMNSVLSEVVSYAEHKGESEGHDALKTEKQVCNGRIAVDLINSETKENSKHNSVLGASQMGEQTYLNKSVAVLSTPDKKVDSGLKFHEGAVEEKQESALENSCLALSNSEKQDLELNLYLGSSEVKKGLMCDESCFGSSGNKEIETSVLIQEQTFEEKSCIALTENGKLQCNTAPTESGKLQCSTTEVLSLSATFTPDSGKEESREVCTKARARPDSFPEEKLNEQDVGSGMDCASTTEAVCSFEEVKLDSCFEDDWPLDEFIEEPEPCAELCLSEWQRCKVTSVDGSRSRLYKTLQLSSLESRAVANCQLQGVWRTCEVTVGDIVSIKAELSDDADKTWVISNDVGFLVQLPDVLLSPTAVVGSVSCTRQGVLNYLFSKPDMEEGSKLMVVGSLIHEMLQQILTLGDYSPECIAAVVEDVISTALNVRFLYSCRMSLNEARTELLQIVPSVQRFCSRYMLSGSEEKAGEEPAEAWLGSIVSVLAVEDNYCVPQLGLKGKVDVTIMAKEKGHAQARLMPLEVKTGQAKNSVEHRGQVILYCLMASQVTPDVDGGLLVYLREGFARKVRVGRPEQRDIILLRNRLARYIVPPQAAEQEGRGLSLPRPISNTRICNWCPHISTCAAFERASQDENCALSPAESHRSKAIVHLAQPHIDYVIHWINLLWLEASDTKSTDAMSDLWCVPPAERVKRGRCLVDLRLDPQVSYKGLDSYHHVFKRGDPADATESCQLCSGEMVVLSTRLRVGVALGFIIELDAESVTLDLARDFTRDCTLHDESYIIDAYEMQSSFKSSLGNLAALLDDTEIAGRLRQFVIDRTPPTFEPSSESSLQLMKGSSFQLNESQLNVVLKALSAQDYLLVKGLPGCGKSTTVAALVNLLVSQGRSVLVTAHTHSAVDTVMQKLMQLRVPFLRLGAVSRVHPSVRPWTELQLTKDCTTPEQLDKTYKSKSVVATTCMGMRHPLFASHSFDVCIVDESSQVLQPVILGPLLRARKFILVGDPDQLPPITRSKAASREGLSKCLFTHLDAEEVTVCLDLQYRMNQRITDLANHLTYGGRLKCGSPAVASAVLQLDPRKISSSLPSWIQLSLSCRVEDSVVFVNVPGTQPYVKECINVKEAAAVEGLVAALLQVGVSCDSIGIMSPYRDQVTYLRGALKSSAPDVEINTVDQYQGRDKDVVIFSCTNNWSIASSAQELRGILSEPRRLNVAVTRARHKLILVGNSSTLKDFSPIKSILEFIGEENIVSFDTS